MSSGHISIVKHFIFATGLIIVVFGGVLFGLMMITIDKPEIENIVVLSIYGVFVGFVWGEWWTLLKNRIPIVDWDDHHLSVVMGLFKRVRYEWRWEELVLSQLFVGDRLKETDEGLYLLVVATRTHEMWVASAQISWKKAKPLVGVIREYVEVVESPYSVEVLRKGPCVQERCIIANMNI